MKKKLQKLAALVLVLALACPLLTTAAWAAPAAPGKAEDVLAQADPYVDFSSDRSTWFFDLDGTGKAVFCDFFSPFDPFTKVETYDPLILFRLEEGYKVSGGEKDRALTMSLDELEKLYDPYFAYTFVPSGGSETDGTLYIRHTLYSKLEVDGFGARSTKLLYYKTVWDLTIPVKGGKAAAGSCTVTTYDPALGGRNLSDFTIDPETARTERTDFTLTSAVERRDGSWYVPANQLMALMGKDCFESEGYLHIQTKGLVDVTAEMALKDRLPLALEFVSGFKEESWEGLEIPAVEIPDASNPWHCGWAETFDKDYTWADYMDDVAGGRRDRGWLWRGFYLSSNDQYFDLNSKPVELTADRIVPYNLYVPHGYDKDETRLVYMLHGGTGNENTATYRLMIREENIREVDVLADEYNYIIVSPNGWTQNPMWRENQALNSFLAAGEMTMKDFPVDEDKVFLTGNSMGGKGVFEIAMRMPERFRAIAPTAAKIAEQAKVNGKNKNVCNLIESEVYSIAKNLADMPVMMAQGNVDTTTSYKVQIGSSVFEGMITNYVMPYLNDATYITVESGSHPHAYGAVLPAIFDFFETQLDPDKDNHSFELLSLPQEGGDTVYLDGTAYTLKVPAKVVDGTVMIALSQLEELYGEDFRSYYIENYNEDPAKMRRYYTVIHNNQVLNFMTAETANLGTDPLENMTLYRRNMERYLEDGRRMDAFKTNPEPLRKQPRFSAAPFEADGEVYVPAVEALTALSERAEILGHSVAEFSDAAFGSQYYEAAAYACANGLMNGTDDGVFSPKETATRGMLMTVLARMDGVDTASGSVWYEAGMNWAVANQLSDGSDPESAVTLEQLAAMVWRYAKSKDRASDASLALTVFDDGESVSEYAAEALSWACGEGLILGSDGKLSPQSPVTRAQMADVLMRFSRGF